VILLPCDHEEHLVAVPAAVGPIIDRAHLGKVGIGAQGNCDRLGDFSVGLPFPLPIRAQAVEGAAMTRPAIERCIKVFIVALIATFIWTVTQVLGLLGWF